MLWQCLFYIAMKDVVRWTDVAGANIPRDMLQILHNHIGSLQAYVDRVSTFEANRFEEQARISKYSVVSLIDALSD